MLPATKRARACSKVYGEGGGGGTEFCKETTSKEISQAKCPNRNLSNPEVFEYLVNSTYTTILVQLCKENQFNCGIFFFFCILLLYSHDGNNLPIREISGKH